ncbi:MAG TPA: PTS mannitol transporter subunit IICBA [Propionibacteriaceae bacterium]|nr:PTS mannitol transporter subunit IICBA [Propionibacteriaceae bacterium]
MSTTTATSATTARAHVQRFGTFLSGMIMPNIGAFIAWGLITTLFIEVGWTPVGALGGFGTHMVDGKEVAWVGLVGPMITYMLPLLIAYTGGRMMYDSHPTRGGVIGTIATMGVIVGSGIPMFIGAMIMGPLAGWSMKKLDSLWEHKIRPGFEMLINNFSAGIWGAILTVFGFYAISPVVTAFSDIAGKGVQGLVDRGLLPLTSILIEPAKILFLNNAINHGVLTPLGTAQAKEVGKSVLFLLEANPGPGLGILLAYMMFGKGMAKASASGAAIIHFFGGIHEIYFPFVLMKPLLILAAIAGGMTGVATNVLFDNGLVAPSAPGSIFAVMAMSAKGDLFGVLLSVLLAATVSCLVASVILKTSKEEQIDDLDAATAKMEEMKGKKSSVSGLITGAAAAPSTMIKNIVFACDAGMGSSAMGASVLRNKIKAAGFGDVTVTNEAIANLKDNYQVVVTHQDLAPRAIPKVPSATVVTVDNFMASPRFDEVVDMIRAQREPAPVAAAVAAPVAAASVAAASVAAAPVAAAPVAAVEDEPAGEILARESIVLRGSASSKVDAIEQAGELLVARGAVEPGYVDAMHERERKVSTYMGNLLAIPHGTNESKEFIHASAMSFIRLDKELDWNGKPVKFVIGIAGRNKEHLAILGKIAKIFSDTEQVAALEKATSADEILEILGKVNS